MASRLATFYKYLDKATKECGLEPFLDGGKIRLKGKLPKREEEFVFCPLSAAIFAKSERITTLISAALNAQSFGVVKDVDDGENVVVAADNFGASLMSRKRGRIRKNLLKKLGLTKNVH